MQSSFETLQMQRVDAICAFEMYLELGRSETGSEGKPIL